MAQVTVRNLHKSFGQVAVIHGVDIDIQDGEFVVLVGPSGCGITPSTTSRTAMNFFFSLASIRRSAYLL